MKEHLGLLPPQGTHPFGENPKPAMLPAPHEHEDFFGTDADRQVSDPLSDDFLAVCKQLRCCSSYPSLWLIPTPIPQLWEGRASKNREIFTEVRLPSADSASRPRLSFHFYVVLDRSSRRCLTTRFKPGPTTRRLRRRVSRYDFSIYAEPLAHR